MEFRWVDWNVEHIGEHGITRAQAEYVVNRNPRYRAGHGKYGAKGQTDSGNYIQVIFVFDPEDVGFVIHARPLTDREKRRYRRRR
jgi:hypothetical protein